MTTTKHRISSKIFVASIVAVIILSLLISPIMAITVTAATSSDASYSDEFKGYGDDTVYNYIHPNNHRMIEFLRNRGYTVLNLIEIRKPYKGEKLTQTIVVGEHEFDY